MAEAVEIPGSVAGVCKTFLAEAPDGLVTGLYLRGGIGFGEWVPGQSDVDFVATLAQRPSDAEVAALERAHAAVGAAHPDLHFDGPHVLASDLAVDPRGCPDVPCVLGRLFEAETAVHDATIAWHELALNGLTVTGPPLETLGVWTSPEALEEFTRNNLDTYWRANAEALQAMPSEGARLDACSWCVLGVARLHHLLVTGEMTTKSAAGRWGLSHYPGRFHRVLREALRIRGDIQDVGGDEYPEDAAARGQDTADFTAYVVRQGTRPDGVPGH
ncbi:MAG TPA: aminoglycoside adenylyltransferase domain-containing protein [Nocardioides sp.]|nr:aminoglycoside adenylyltransferase domain-containing protein [Nocardioides sp.]